MWRNFISYMYFSYVLNVWKSHNCIGMFMSKRNYSSWSSRKPPTKYIKSSKVLVCQQQQNTDWRQGFLLNWFSGFFWCFWIIWLVLIAEVLKDLRQHPFYQCFLIAAFCSSCFDFYSLLPFLYEIRMPQKHLSSCLSGSLFYCYQVKFTRTKSNSKISRKKFN